MRKHFFRRKEEKMKISTKTIVTVGMFTAVLAVLSILQIPMPTGVPITLQTFAMALCGYVLGWQSGVAATLLYIVLGTVGVPIFAVLYYIIKRVVEHVLKKRRLPEGTDEYIELDTVDTVTNEVKMKATEEPEASIRKYEETEEKK